MPFHAQILLLAPKIGKFGSESAQYIYFGSKMDILCPKWPKMAQNDPKWQKNSISRPEIPNPGPKPPQNPIFCLKVLFFWGKTSKNRHFWGAAPPFCFPRRRRRHFALQAKPRPFPSAPRRPIGSREAPPRLLGQSRRSPHAGVRAAPPGGAAGAAVPCGRGPAPPPGGERRPLPGADAG